MSLRNKSTSEGYGATVSVGVTAHAAFVDVAVAASTVVDGAVGVSPHPHANAAPAAPTGPRASRRVKGQMSQMRDRLVERSCGLPAGQQVEPERPAAARSFEGFHEVEFSHRVPEQVDA